MIATTELDQLVQQLKQYALDNYDLGGHWAYETYDKGDYIKILQWSNTFDQAKAALRAWCERVCENPLVIFTPDNKILIGSCAYPTHLTTSFLNEVFERSNLFQYVQKVRSQLHIRGADGVNYPIPNDKSYITYDLAQGKFVNMNSIS